LRYIIALLLLLSIFAVAPAGYAEEDDLIGPMTELPGLDYLGIPIASHDMDTSFTVIDFEIENTGYETFFIALPEKWESFDGLEDYSARAEAVITNRRELRLKYGDPNRHFTFAQQNFVFFQPAGFGISRGSPMIFENVDSGAESLAWRIRPNERLKVHIRMTFGDDEQAVINPLALEQNRTDINLLMWDQEFNLFQEADEPNGGFLVAPYILKRGTGTMMESIPGIVANLSHFNSSFIWKLARSGESPFPTAAPDTKQDNGEDVVEKKAVTSPEWDEWFMSSGLFSLTSNSLADLETEQIDIPVIEKPKPEDESTEDPNEDTEASTNVWDTEDFIPVWLFDFDRRRSVRYKYRWQEGKVYRPGIATHLYSRPFITKTQSWGSGTPPLPSAPAVSVSDPTPTKPELDLTTVPEWYDWF
jgi:hypothetical protein